MKQQKIFISTILGFLFLISASFIFKNKMELNEKETKIEISTDEIMSPNLEKLDFDTIVHFINKVYSNLPTLSETAEKETQCDWLEKYQENLSNEIVQKYGNRKNLFRIVGITKMNEKEYVIFYKNQCRFVNENKISESIKNRFNKIYACSLPNEKNKIQPTGFRNHYSKIHMNKGETQSLIQVWHKG